MSKSVNVRHTQESHGSVFVDPERERVGTVEVLCSRARRRMDHSAIHTPYRLFSNTVSLDPTPVQSWPAHSDVACWYCCHSFTTVPISIPRSIVKLESKKYFEVYGVFCSLNCAKKHLLSLHTHDQQQLLMQLNELCVNVYGMHTDHVFNAKEAPPKFFLKMFGGHMDIDEFRAKSISTRTVLVTPPFVSHAMMLEEHSGTGGSTTSSGTSGHATEHAVRNLRRPSEPVPVLEAAPKSSESRFDMFLKKRNTEVGSSVTPVTTTKRKRKRDPVCTEEDGGGGGGLGGFLKPKSK